MNLPKWAKLQRYRGNSFSVFACYPQLISHKTRRYSSVFKKKTTKMQQKKSELAYPARLVNSHVLSKKS